MESLNEFIQNNPDPRELKRALAVKMVEQNYGYAQISELLGVSLGFISNYRQQFLNHGIEGLRLKYQGSKGYLSSQQKQNVINWLQQKNYWQLLELQTHELLVQPYKKGESSSTIAFLKYLQSQYPESRIALIWDGAQRIRADRRLTTTRRLTPSHHRSGEVKSYLDSVNQGLKADKWKITCIRFAPNAPEQNPIEDVWLSAKRFVREFYSLCSSFAIAKRLFELATEHQVFNFPKLSLYGSFS